MRNEDVGVPERSKGVISREDLYRQAWLMPMRALSELYGLSERALRKICSIHLIPVPPASYWEHSPDKPRRHTKLGKVANTALHTIILAERYTAPPGDYLQTVLRGIEDHKTPAPVGRPQSRAVPGKPEELVSTKRVAEEKAAIASNNAKERPSSRPKGKYPAISGYIAKLRALDSDRDGFVYLKWVKVPPNKISRVAGLLYNLADLLRLDDLVFDETAAHVGFARGGSTVNFEINFPRMQTMVPTGWSDYRRREYRHIGRMTFRIFGSAEGVRKNFSDGDTMTVEDSIDKLAASFRAAILHELDKDAKEREAARQRSHLAHRRELAALRGKRESERVEFLRHVADVNREVEDLRATISVLDRPANENPELERMLAWAEQRLSSLSATISPERLAADLVGKSLFPEADELFDPEGEP